MSRGVGILVLAGLLACTARPTVSLPYTQDFSAPTLGSEWSSTGGGWQVVDGRLHNGGAHNVPLWLSAALPRDVRVTFLAESKSDAVDLKVEIFGDGRRHESGYIVVVAGWNNTRSIIGRLAEHGERYNPVRTLETTEALRQEVERNGAAAVARYRDRREISQRPVTMQPNRVYRFQLERRNHDLRVYLDGELHLEHFDPSPLYGPGHDRFAFNNWASEVYFDELSVSPL
jgi:hypothetical protein